MSTARGSRMPLRVLCCFSHLTGPDGWTDPHHCVNQFVNAVKGRRLPGYAYVRVSPDTPRRRLDETNAGAAVEWFGEMGATMLLNERLETPLALVPIPDSQCVAPAAPPRTRRLAEALAARIQDAVVLDVLRFDTPMRSAHAEQGCRDAQSLYLHLRLVGAPVADRTLVLVDDVIATGGHLAAARALFRDHGVGVDLAVCAVSAERTAHASPFDRVVRTVDDYVPRPHLKAEWLMRYASSEGR